MSNQDKPIPTLPIIDLIDMDMSRSEEVKMLIDHVRRFLNIVHRALSEPIDEGNIVMVQERLQILSNVLPSSSMAKAIAIKAFHKHKLELTIGYLNNPEMKKLGTQRIKDLSKDGCYNELALMTLADETHSDIVEQIGIFRSILSTHRAEIEAKIGYSQT